MTSSSNINPGTLSLELNNEKIYCVADLHLCESRPQEIVDFSSEVIACSSKHSVLLILGDLFDVYVGPEDLQAPEFTPLFSAFDLFSSTGQVIVIRGNRDVLISPRHVENYSFDVCDTVIAINDDERVLYVHGDVFCTADVKYQRLRRLLRNRAIRLVLRLLPVTVRRWLGKRMRRVSTAEVARKEMSEMQLDYEAISAVAKRFSVSSVKIGHLHIAQQQQITENCLLEVLPAWQPQLTYG
ncbi:MAG: UDP-2,3-diacylglucosamine hydrolase [Myxococcota bacterium]|jgi:UDP-2,3-diacylglucosamine hydrolase